MTSEEQLFSSSISSLEELKEVLLAKIEQANKEIARLAFAQSWEDNLERIKYIHEAEVLSKLLLRINR